MLVHVHIVVTCCIEAAAAQPTMHSNRWLSGFPARSFTHRVRPLFIGLQLLDSPNSGLLLVCGDSPTAVTALPPPQDAIAIGPFRIDNVKVLAPAPATAQSSIIAWFFCGLFCPFLAHYLCRCNSESLSLFRSRFGCTCAPTRSTPCIEAAAAQPTRQSNQ